MAADIRDAYFDQIYHFAAQDESLVFLSADADAFSLQRFKKDFSDRYINVGVAEQNMATLAAGLALAGKSVFIYAILSFLTLRCYEQIKFNICGMNLPITLVGVGSGYSFDFDGPSHHGVTDIGVMRMLPEMTICNPATAATAQYYADFSYHSPSPVCVRLDKGSMDELYAEPTDFSAGMNSVRQGRDLTILATGREVYHAVEIATLLRANNIDAGVVDVHRLKSIDLQTFLDLTSSSDRIVTLEENSIIGGLGTIVAELMVDNKIYKPLKRCALPDVQCFAIGKRQWLMEQDGLSTDSLVESIKQWI